MKKSAKEQYVKEETLADILKTLATKDDLKRFATKDDLKRFATKDDLKQFATKDDLQKSTNFIVTTIDGFIKRLETQEIRTWTNVQRWKDIEPIVENHEHRLVALEKKITV